MDVGVSTRTAFVWASIKRMWLGRKHAFVVLTLHPARRRVVQECGVLSYYRLYFADTLGHAGPVRAHTCVCWKISFVVCSICYYADLKLLGKIDSMRYT